MALPLYIDTFILRPVSGLGLVSVWCLVSVWTLKHDICGAGFFARVKASINLYNDI
jgi:hypothetical protein